MTGKPVTLFTPLIPNQTEIPIIIFVYNIMTGEPVPYQKKDDTRLILMFSSTNYRKVKLPLCASFSAMFTALQEKNNTRSPSSVQKIWMVPIANVEKPSCAMSMMYAL